MNRWPNAAEAKRHMNEVIKEFYGENGEKMPATVVPEINAPPRPRGKKITTVTKSVATMIANGEPPPAQPDPPQNVVPTVAVIREVKAQPSGAKKVSKSVQAILGQTFGYIQVIDLNEVASADTSKSKAGKALPHVNCHCTNCNSDFVMNAYWISGGQKTDCGCLLKRGKK